MTINTEISQLAKHSSWIEIRMDRLLANLEVLKQQAGPTQGVMAVVKANAYGHGLIKVAGSLAPHVTFLGVSSVLEALELKEHQIGSSIFLFGRLMSSELPSVLMDGITLSLSSFEEALEISSVSSSLHRTTPVHVKVDTGMGRLGIPYSEALRTIEKIKRLPALALEGIYTHFPAAERNDGFLSEQLGDFALLLEQLEGKGIPLKYRHAANSAASLNIRSPIFNLIRPGITLYGIYPDESFRPRATFKPILSLKSRIILLKRLKPGQTVGYGRTFIARQGTTIAILAIGYSHGYPFNASPKAQVLYKGRRFPLAGRVSMDYSAIDIGDIPARVGDEVTLIGDDGEDCIHAEELARWAGTIPYEIVTQLAPRLPRYYREFL